MATQQRVRASDHRLLSTSEHIGLREGLMVKFDDATCRKDTRDAYIPHAALREIWSDDILQELVNQKQLGLDEHQIAHVKEYLLQMISLLVFIEWEEWWRFRDIFFLTSNLSRRRRDKNIPYLDRNDLEDSSFLSRRASHKITSFLQNRWRFCPLVIEEGDPMDFEGQYHLEWRLPLINIDPDVCQKGAFGTVTKEIIARGHFIPKFPPVPCEKEVVVARKVFPKHAYTRELKLLELLRNSPRHDKRIVYDLVTITMPNKDVHILLPWADMDLDEFMRRGDHYRHIPPRNRLRDLLSELAQLAGALDFLHGGIEIDVTHPKAVCHMDLKPANILVYKQEGNPSWTGEWKITDFGISSTAAMQAGYKFYSATKRRKHLDGPYFAPERDISPASDIWSFGCIIARVLAMGLGPQELQVLDDMRAQPDLSIPDNRTDYFCRGSRLNSHVKTWIESLPERYSHICNLDFLTEMRCLLLCMLTEPKDRRPRAKKVHEKLLLLRDLASRTSSGRSIDSMTQANPRGSPSETRAPQPRQLRNGLELCPINVGTIVDLIKSAESSELQDRLQQATVDVEQTHDNERPLVHAIKVKNASAIKVLLDHKPDLNVGTPDAGGDPPLILAVKTGDEHVVEALLKAPQVQTYLDKLSSSGRTPLMEAALHGHTGIVKALLDHGAKCDIVSPKDRGWTCLHYAVFNDTTGGELILAFKDKANFKKIPHLGRTPLEQFCVSFARFARNNEQWRGKLGALIECGSEVNSGCNGTGVYPCPLDLAVEKENWELAGELRNRKAILSKDFRPPRDPPAPMRDFLAKMRRSSRSSTRS